MDPAFLAIVAAIVGIALLWKGPEVLPKWGRAVGKTMASIKAGRLEGEREFREAEAALSGSNAPSSASPPR
jgi:Sec-independent protein translocase protein TatA